MPIASWTSSADRSALNCVSVKGADGVGVAASPPQAVSAVIAVAIMASIKYRAEFRGLSRCVSGLIIRTVYPWRRLVALPSRRLEEGIFIEDATWQRLQALVAEYALEDTVGHS